jgi:DNA polymerase-1
MKGLMGDTSDNIPGVQGIGPKTASNIIQKYHCIEAALEDIENVKPDKARKNLDAEREMALFSRDLATIKLDCEWDKTIDDAKVSDESVYSTEVYNILLENGMKSLLKRFENKDISKDKIAVNISVEPKDIDYSTLISTINKSGEESVGIGLTRIDDTIYGAAVSVGDDTFIVRDDKITNLRKDIKSEITNLLTRSMKINKIKSAVAVAAVLISAAKVIVEGLEKVKGDKLIGNSDNTEPATNV